MDEKLLNKLVEVLKSHGLADEEIEKVKTELTVEDEPKDDESVEEEKVETETTTNDSPVAEGEDVEVEETEESKPVESEEPGVEEKVDEVPVEEEPVVEPQVEEPEPPVEEEQPNELPEGVEEINPDQPQELEQQPTESADTQRLLHQIEEERKAREGLMARIVALESALKECGVMSVSHVEANPVGVDDPTRVQDYHDDDEMFDRILNDVNKPQY